MCENLNKSLPIDNDFSKEEKLIYVLLFSKKYILNIILDDYCEYTNRTKFKEKIRKIAKKGNVRIIDDRVLHNNDYLIWKIEVRR